jgi:hypothetical protein
MPPPRLMPPSVPRLMAPATPSFIARSAIRVAAGTTDLMICLPNVVQNPSLREPAAFFVGAASPPAASASV